MKACNFGKFLLSALKRKAKNFSLNSSFSIEKKRKEKKNTPI
jgi:hypothetical protein